MILIDEDVVGDADAVACNSADPMQPGRLDESIQSSDLAVAVASRCST